MSTKLNISPERFAQGLTMQQYFSGIETNKDVIAESYANFKLRPEDADFFRDLGLDLNVLVLLEDWCGDATRSEEHTSELQSRFDLVCRLLLEKKKLIITSMIDSCSTKT